MDEKKKKKINYYKNLTRKSKRFKILPNMKGFLCSCNSQEKESVQEAYNILNKYADSIYGQETPQLLKSEDVDTELVNEIKTLQRSDKDKKRFQLVDVGLKNLFFISTTLDDPFLLVKTVAEDIIETNISQSRYLIRLIPIEITCKAYINDIKITIEKLLDKYFSQEPKTFSIVYNHRNNNNLDKIEVIKTIADSVLQKNSEHKVNLDNAEISIIVEIIKSIALVSIVPNFKKYKKFNLHSLSLNVKQENKIV